MTASTSNHIQDAKTKGVTEKGAESDGLLVSAESDVTPALTVVMPTLNEEAGIRECIDRIKTAVETLGLKTEIVISDSSTDRTPEIAREMGAIVVNPDRAGYGYAYRYAFERVRGEYVVMGDADTTYDFEAIPQLLERLIETDTDMVLGSRLEGDIELGAMPLLHQYIGNPALTAFLNAFYGTDVSDAHCGFRVLRRDALEALELKTDGMEFASEMIMQAGAKDMRIEEVPITYYEREGEATLESFKDGWRHVRFMLVNAPGYLFSVPGVLLGLVGTVIMGMAVTGTHVGATSPGLRSIIAGGLLVIIGYQIASFGVFAAIAGEPIRKPRDPLTTWITEHMTLERGASFGLLLFVTGVGYASYLITLWMTDGYTALPIIRAEIAAFVAIVLGLQTVFGSFFLSTIAE